MIEKVYVLWRNDPTGWTPTSIHYAKEGAKNKANYVARLVTQGKSDTMMVWHGDTLIIEGKTVFNISEQVVE